MKKYKGVPGFELATYRHAHQKQACTLLCTCVTRFFFVIGMLPFIERAYLVCVAHKNENIDLEKLNNGASALEYLVPYSSFRVYQKQLYQQQECTLLYKQTYQQGTQPSWACR